MAHSSVARGVRASKGGEESGVQSDRVWVPGKRYDVGRGARPRMIDVDRGRIVRFGRALCRADRPAVSSSRCCAE